MANNSHLHTQPTAVAQVKTITITADSTSNTAVWTLTYTDDDGATATVTYTEDGSPTVTEIATGLFNAWNASTNPLLTGITATNPSAGVVVLTADTAGVPFSVALADSDDGTHTESATTANVGASDYGTAQIWELAAVPAATNDVLFGPAATMNDMLYTLNQSAIAIADFRVFPGCSSKFGRFTPNGLPHYLRIDPDLFRYEGSGSRNMFDIGSANISPYIAAQGSPEATGRHTVCIKGSNIATLLCVKGNIGVAPFDGDTATVATITTTYESTLASDVNLTVGSGVTLTTLTQGGGQALLKCAATTVTNAANCTLTTEGSGAITTMTANGTVYPNSTGTITTLNARKGCTLDFRKNRAARTVTTLNLYPGCTVHLHSGITVTNQVFMVSGANDSTSAITIYWHQ